MIGVAFVLASACSDGGASSDPDAAGHDSDAMAMDDAGAELGDDAGSSADAASGERDAATLPGQSSYFSSAFFLEDVSGKSKAANSDAIVRALRAGGGWGNGDRFQIDFSMEVLEASASTEKRSFVARTEDNGFDDEFYSPDCDQLPVPVPPGGNIEGEDGYARVRSRAHTKLASIRLQIRLRCATRLAAAKDSHVERYVQRK